MADRQAPAGRPGRRQRRPAPTSRHLFGGYKQSGNGRETGPRGPRGVPGDQGHHTADAPRHRRSAHEHTGRAREWRTPYTTVHCPLIRPHQDDHGRPRRRWPASCAAAPRGPAARGRRVALRPPQAVPGEGCAGRRSRTSCDMLGGLLQPAWSSTRAPTLGADADRDGPRPAPRHPRGTRPPASSSPGMPCRAVHDAAIPSPPG